ncbi:histone lysine methyltransferase Set9 [Microbotryomycetes sp. JL201]|nr:histone lysine methyltransferase Set9 [Microbotryomycetes sp. JL201]
MSFVAVNAAVNAQWLSGADDLCSRLFLDFCIFDEPKVDGRRTGKMDMRGKAEPRLSDADLELAREIVRKLRRSEITAAEATDKLCERLSYFKTFVNKWDPDDEDLFKVHVKRYCYAMRPDSGIAFHETDRYTRTVKTVQKQASDSPSRAIAAAAAAATANRTPDTFIEVGVFATRSYKKGETIQLRGGVADLSEEEDDKMREDGGRSDFSVLWSDRKKCFCLLLGPARFVNHDCRNNVVFQLTGSNMTFKVIEDIEIDDEIFTHYGDHYFDMNNARCLCATCQKFKRGAFASKNLAAAKTVEATSEASTSRRLSRSTPIQSQRSTPTRELAPRAARPSGSLKANEATRQAFEAKALAAATARDELRVGLRLPHPRLRPPPGYAECYHYDERKKVFKYTGPRAKAVKTKKTVVQESTTPKSRNGKRQRDDSPSSPAPVPRKRVTVTRTVQMKPLRLGVRSSRRTSVLSSSETAREIAFERLKRALGRYNSSSDDEELSEISDTESAVSRSAVISDSVTVEVQLTVPPDDDKTAASSSSASPQGIDEQEVEALLLPADGLSPASPVGERPPSLDPAPWKRERDSESVTTGRDSSASVPPPAPKHPDLSARQFSLTQSPVPENDPDFGESVADAADAQSSSRTRGDNYARNMSKKAADGRNNSSNSIAGGNGGDDPHKRKPPEFEKVDEEMNTLEVGDEDDEERDNDARERASDESGRQRSVQVKMEHMDDVVMPSVTPLSETGSTMRDPDTREAAAFLLMLRSVTAPALEEPPMPSTTKSTAQNSKPTHKTQAKRGRTADGVNGKEPKGPRLSHHERQSASKGKGKIKALKSSSPDSVGGSAETGPKRGTRRSAPIAGNLSDVLRDPSVMSVAGFYDPILGKYRSRGSLAVEVSGVVENQQARISSPNETLLPDVSSADKGEAPIQQFEPPPAAEPPGTSPRNGVVRTDGEARQANSVPGERLVKSNIRIGKTAIMRRLSAPSSSTSSASAGPSLHVAEADGSKAPASTMAVAIKVSSSKPKSPNSRHVVAEETPGSQVEAKPFVRGTRRTAPIESTLAELVSSQQVAAVSGAFDWDTRRYVSRRAASFGGVVVRPPKPVQDPSSEDSEVDTAHDPNVGRTVESDLSDVPDSAEEGESEDGPSAQRADAHPKATSKGRAKAARKSQGKTQPSPSESRLVVSPSGGKVDFDSPRSSRSRNPIQTSLSDLVTNPVVLAATGGWDSETGRYKGIRKRPSVTDPSGASG